MTTITTPSSLALVPGLETAWQDVDSSFERFCLTGGSRRVAARPVGRDFAESLTTIVRRDCSPGLTPFTLAGQHQSYLLLLPSGRDFRA
jgi:hypothetical protein